MRTTKEIEDRVRFLLVEELDRRVGESQKRLPHRCINNHRQPLDTRKKVEDEPNDNYNQMSNRGLPVVQTIGLCMLGSDNPEEWPGNICEDPVDAQRCPWFTPTQSKTELWEEFSAQVSDLDWLKDNFPEAFGLLWAVSSQSPPSLPWWKGLWFRYVLRVEIEPVKEIDSLKLLPSPEEEIDASLST